MEWNEMNLQHISIPCVDGNLEGVRIGWSKLCTTKDLGFGFGMSTWMQRATLVHIKPDVRLFNAAVLFAACSSKIEEWISPSINQNTFHDQIIHSSDYSLD